MDHIFTSIKTLFANISLVVFLNLLIKPIWVLVEMEIQDVVGHEAWGMYAALFSLGFLFLALADLGINPYTTQKLAAQPGLLKQHVSSLLLAKLVLMLVYPILMLGIGYLLGYRSTELYFLGLISAVHAGIQLLEFFRANFRAMQRFGIDAYLSVFDRLFLLFWVALLFYYGLTVERFIYARMLSIGIGAVCFYVLLVRTYGKIHLKLDMGFLRKTLKASWPFAMMTILYSVHDKVDQVMIERISGQEETGLYAAAYRWIDAFSMYLWTILPIFFARFAFHVHNKQAQERLLHFGYSLSSIPILFICLFGWFYGDQLMFLFDRSSPEELRVMNSCLQVLFLALLVNGTFTVFSTLLSATGHVRIINRVILLSIVLNIGLNAYYIPQHGAIASAWTTFASFCLANICYVMYVVMHLKIKFPLRQFSSLVLLGVLLFLCFTGLENISANWWLNTLIAGVGYLGLAFVFGILRMKDLRSFRSDPQ